MGFKFWGAAPGGFFENPTIFGVFGLKIQDNSGKKSKILEKSQFFRKFSRGPPRARPTPATLPSPTTTTTTTKNICFYMDF